MIYIIRCIYVYFRLKWFLETNLNIYWVYLMGELDGDDSFDSEGFVK